MTDQRIEKFARILVGYSTRVKPGDRVAITTTTVAEPLVGALYGQILERGGSPHVLLDIPGQDEILFAHASDAQLEYVSAFHKMAYEQFDVLLKVKAETNTRSMTDISPARQARRQKGQATLLEAQIRRGANGSLRWMSTIFPTQAYAAEAEMKLSEFQDFFFRSSHADESTSDPVAEWQRLEEVQSGYIKRIEGHDQVEIRGPNVDLKLSIKGRKMVNAAGRQNMPDGEIYTGPVEDSLNGWVRYSFPAIYQGNEVDGVELTFKSGRVVKAIAKKNQDLLLQMLDVDAGARYVGEFAIGTNYQINRFTKNILLDEKIGGSFHMALGAGYPETGSLNRSNIHWDMICDLREDSEILLDGEAVYRNGHFLI